MINLETVKKQTKYGLQVKRPLLKVKNNLCFDDSLENDDADYDMDRVNKYLVQNEKKANSEAAKVQKSALAEDASIFDYDGSYDSFKKVSTIKEKSEFEKKELQKPKYISNLLVLSKVREKEKDRIYERNLLKERIKEDDKFCDKEKFMTSAYKQKLMEDNKWDYEDRLTDEIEKRTDCRAQGMHGFYSNLLTKNIAMGGALSAGVSAYTAGSLRQQQVLQETETETERELVREQVHTVDATDADPAVASAGEPENKRRKMSPETFEPPPAPSPADSTDKSAAVQAARDRFLKRTQSKTSSA